MKEHKKMKKLTTIWLLIIVSATMALAQSKDEQEILKIHAALDTGVFEKRHRVFRERFR